MDPEALETKGLRPSDVRQAYVTRYALRLGERATLVPTREGRVYGTVMTLKHQDVDRLYSEPSVAAYRPEPVLAQLMDGTAEPALCFNLPMQQGSSSHPEYAIALQAVARARRLRGSARTGSVTGSGLAPPGDGSSARKKRAAGVRRPKSWEERAEKQSAS
jgi:hypothetical protein